MPLTVTFSDPTFIDNALTSGLEAGRTDVAQIEHWARLGRLVERAKIIDFAKVDLTLQGEVSIDLLSPQELRLHTEMLHEYLESLDGSDTRILDDIGKAGGTIASMDRHGNIIKDK